MMAQFPGFIVQRSNNSSSVMCWPNFKNSSKVKIGTGFLRLEKRIGSTFSPHITIAFTWGRLHCLVQLCVVMLMLGLTFGAYMILQGIRNIFFQLLITVNTKYCRFGMRCDKVALIRAIRVVNPCRDTRS